MELGVFLVSKHKTKPLESQDKKGWIMCWEGAMCYNARIPDIITEF